jgi:hypothetical protein
MHKLFPRARTVESTAEFDTLIAVPIVDHVLEDDGETVVLLEPRFRGWWLLERWLQPRLGDRRAYVRVKLDRRGSHIWRQMNDRCEIGELIERFRLAFPEEAADAAQRVRLFLVGMMRHRFIQLLARSD